MNLPVNYDSIDYIERRKVREEYVRLQDGRCYHCNYLLTETAPMHHRPVNINLFPPNFFKYPVHLHHCHKTGLTIGAVHNYCNAVLWQYHGE